MRLNKKYDLGGQSRGMSSSCRSPRGDALTINIMFCNFIQVSALRTMGLVFFCIGFNERTFQHISGHIKMVTICNGGFIMLSRWNITPQAHSYDILSGHIILATVQPVFALNYRLYVEQKHKGASTTNLEIDPGPPGHGVNALPLDFQCWYCPDVFNLHAAVVSIW